MNFMTSTLKDRHETSRIEKGLRPLFKFLGNWFILTDEMKFLPSILVYYLLDNLLKDQTCSD